MTQKQILIAAGGTGGHLFPAQALAEQLKERGASVLFAGAGLETNRYFERQRFPYFDVPSVTPFGGKRALFKAPWVLGRGVLQSLRLLKTSNVAVVVGFGSYHSFPMLMAATLKKTSLVLFEPNAYPGKVNRLFSKRARFTALLFDEGEKWVKGRVKKVSPLVRKMESASIDEVRHYFSLDFDKFTLLVFGGSQGARGINDYLKELAPRLAEHRHQWQILHFTGTEERSEEMKKEYAQLGITACVKPFEEKMGFAWNLADLVVSRSGASTASEHLHFCVPAIFIPFPHATDDHQAKNAHVMTNIGGAVSLREGVGAPEELLATLERFMNRESGALEKMATALKGVKEKEDQQHLASLILEYIER